MTLDDVRAAAIPQLHAQGHLLHSQVTQLAGGDAALMRKVWDSLLAEGLAVDKYGVVLVAVGEVAHSALASPWTSVPQTRETASGLPPIALAQQPLAPSHRGEQHDLGSTRTKPLATVSPDKWRLSGTPQYVLWSGGREAGPFPREELEQRLAEGRLQPTDFVRIDSEDEWLPASKALARAGPSPVSDRMPAVGAHTPPR